MPNPNPAPLCDRPIGVFDSGLGGLTVVRAIRTQLPHESIIYLGDTARVPYGARSPETIIRYARTCGRALAARNIKMLVVACNTVSAVALDVLRVELDLPVLGVIVPGASAAVQASRSGRIGVIATTSTVASGAYARAVAAQSSTAEVHSLAAPLLVPLVEEGWLDDPITEQVIARYLAELVPHEIDALVLGCTHYPMLHGPLERVAARVLGAQVAVVDSAQATASELKDFLSQRGLATTLPHSTLKLMVTDRPQQFAAVASRFLGHTIEDVSLIDL
ncbi:MAG: glutamate racemase [Deltaproteobacteria bacterium]|nr:glutamate racemase [Deltaproteobacteria bacterium]